MAPIDELRAAERAYLDTGEERQLSRAEAVVEGDLREAPYAPATRLWLSLLRYDRTGDDRHLDAAAGTCRAVGWRDPSVADVAVAVLLRRWARDGAAADLDHAIGLGRPLGALVPPGRRDEPLWLTPAWRAIDVASVYLERTRLTGADDDLMTARGMLRRAVRATRQPTILAAGLGQLAGCEQELYLRHGPRRLLDQAIRRYQQALAAAGRHSPIRPMLLTELGTALQDKFAEDEEPGDIDRAVALAQEAVAQVGVAGASRPDLACHLVNLGTALNTRYEQMGDPGDLDEALRCWTVAVDVLPPASAYRPAFDDRLALGLMMRWEHGGGGEADLNAAIHYGQAAVRDGAAAPDAAIYAGHLADALQHRWELHRSPGDLNEAIRVFAGALGSQAGDTARAADLACNFAHTVLSRYEAMGDSGDLDAAMTALGQIPAARLGRSQRATLSASAARVLTMRYLISGDPGDLAGAIAAARRGLSGTRAMSTTRNSRAARLAHLLYLRYASRGQRRDLDVAILMLREVTAGAGDRREASPDQLSQLSGYLAERYERDGDPADRDAAIRLSRQAQESDRRDEEPTMAASLAAVLHDRFKAEGWLDDLDEAVARHRQALARLVPAAPVYPAILNNLGIVLQDCFVYRGDAALLDEAVELHERAAAACPPGSPERTGYLGTLAAAVQLRFDRDHRAADLDWVIGLGEQALACLGPGAPERAMLLSNLAAARHQHARGTADPAEFDSAIATYRAALHRVRGNSPARPRVLGGYARALGDHPAGHGKARVLRAFCQALAASGHAPLVRLDVASSLGEWALESQLWAEAADAYHAAAAARRTLFGAQLDRASRNTWLALGEEITVGEACAWVRSRQPRRAAAALESGRALALSQALDASTVSDRLRARNLPELAARYQRATELLARAAAARSELRLLPGWPG